MLKALKDQKEDTILHCISELPAFLSVDGSRGTALSPLDFPDLRALSSPYLGSSAVTPTGVPSPISPTTKPSPISPTTKPSPIPSTTTKPHRVFSFDNPGHSAHAKAGALPLESKKNMSAVGLRGTRHL